MPNSTDSPSLVSGKIEYASIALNSRRRLWRWIGIGLIVSLVVATAMLVRRPVATKFHLLALQRECAAFETSGHSVWASGSAAVVNGLTPACDWQSYTADTTRRCGTLDDLHPVIIAPISHMTYRPRCWTLFSQAAALPAYKAKDGTAILYVHARTSRSGVRRLVVVDVGAGGMKAYVYQEASLFSDLKDVTGVRMGVWLEGAGYNIWYGGTTLQQGITDKTDPAAFTIPFGTGAQFIYARLVDQESVRFSATPSVNLQ